MDKYSSDSVEGALGWLEIMLFPDDVIIQLIFDRLGGVVHVWFDKDVKCVMCPLILSLTFEGEIWSRFGTGLSYKGNVSLVWKPDLIIKVYVHDMSQM